jgi:hypothetical protein
MRGFTVNPVGRRFSGGAPGGEWSVLGDCFCVKMGALVERREDVALVHPAIGT